MAINYFPDTAAKSVGITQSIQEGALAREQARANIEATRASTEEALQRVQSFREQTAQRLAESKLAQRQAEAGLELLPETVKLQKQQTMNSIRSGARQESDEELGQIASYASAMMESPEAYEQGYNRLLSSGLTDTDLKARYGLDPSESFEEQQQVLGFHVDVRENRMAEKGILAADQEIRTLNAKYDRERELLNMRLQADQAQATADARRSLIASTRAEVSQKDLGFSDMAAARETSHITVASMLPNVFDDPANDADQKTALTQISNDIMVRAKARMDEDVRNYNRARLTDAEVVVPLTYEAYVQKETREAVGRMGKDGKYYADPNNAELKSYKQKWLQTQMTNPKVLQRFEDAGIVNPGDQLAVLADAFGNPVARGFAAGSK